MQILQPVLTVCAGGTLGAEEEAGFVVIGSPEPDVVKVVFRAAALGSRPQTPAWYPSSISWETGTFDETGCELDSWDVSAELTDG